MNHLQIYYRGRLSSCNYACSYCPFAKAGDSRNTLTHDKTELNHFISWAIQQKISLDIFFTPWGEALVRKHYRDALVQLSHTKNIRAVGIQTNLSTNLKFCHEAQLTKLRFWCTFHPEQVSLEKFISRVKHLANMGVLHSVGMVAEKKWLHQIPLLKTQLPPETSFWLNAFEPQETNTKRAKDYYTDQELAYLTQTDPWFEYNVFPKPSLGATCRAGEHSVSIDGQGNIRRCHFVNKVIGNIYQDNWQACLMPRTCPNKTCDCYIGYVQRYDLPIYESMKQDAVFRQMKPII